MTQRIFAAVLVFAIGLAGDADAKRCRDPTTHLAAPCASVGGAAPGKVAPGTWPKPLHCAKGLVHCGTACVPMGEFCQTPPR